MKFQDTTILEQEVMALTTYLSKRGLDVGEVDTLLKATIDQNNFVKSMIGARKISEMVYKNE